MSARAGSGVPATRDIPHIPTGADDEPVFASPWEARAFALVVDLHRRGHFSWSAWVAQLAAEIAAAGSADDGSGYYLLWLSAAEKLVAARALAARSELAARKAALEAAQGGPAGP
ncbi:MAG: nitrile hydratase accessory protein [Gammaproteobacteria bacterium]